MEGSGRLRNATICCLLAVATLVVFWPVHQFGFTHYDDENYVSQNSIVTQGLTLRGIWWAFTKAYFSYWHPLTWMSHMLDVNLFGVNGGAHHLVSVVMHAANAILLFLMLNWMTQSWGKSALVAALFALHPAHVESVAWIAERKDVLSGFFWILTCWAYAWYAENRQLKRYLIALLFFACGLMSKPMVVTLPCVLILLDWWPLGRFQWTRSIAVRSYAPVSLKQLLAEKVPFFAGSLFSVAITYIGVLRAGSIVSEEVFPMGLRWANVPISYARYLGKLFWPDNLTVMYPMPESWPLWTVIASSALIVVLTVVFAWLARRAPYLITGWLWFLGPLVPTIGLIPVGWQSIADRYTYIPFIGLFWMVAWGMAGLRLPRTLLGTAAAASVIACAIVSRAQVWVWKDTEALFAHSVAVTRDNFISEYNLALARYLKGDRESARHYFEEAVRTNPRYEPAQNNLGAMLLQSGEYARATNHFHAVLRIKSDHDPARHNLAKALIQLNDCAGAKVQIDALLRRYPNWAEVLHLAGVCLAINGKSREAQGYFEAALNHQPEYEPAQIGLARSLIARGKTPEGIAQLQRVLDRNPGSTNALQEFAWVTATHPEVDFPNRTEVLASAQKKGIKATKRLPGEDIGFKDLVP